MFLFLGLFCSFFWGNMLILLIFMRFGIVILIFMMEIFWIRILLFGDDFFEIISGMELYERFFEYINWEFYGNVCNNFWIEFFIYDFLIFGDSNEYLVVKKIFKEYSYIYMFLLILLFVIVLIMENIFYYKFFENIYVLIFFYWLESGVIVLFFRFWGRKWIRR